MKKGITRSHAFLKNEKSVCAHLLREETDRERGGCVDRSRSESDTSPSFPRRFRSLKRVTTQTKRLAVVLVWSLLSSFASSRDDAWPMFRGGVTRTGVSRASLSFPLKVAWTHETEAPIHCGAAIQDGAVFVGNEDGLFVALDLATGTRRWEHKVKGAIQSSPAVFKNKVFFGDDYGVLHCLDTDSGQEVWSFETGDKIIASPGFQEGTMWVGSYDYGLYALDMETGKQKWKYEAEAQIHCSPCLAAGEILTGGCDGYLRMINATTGVQRAELHVGDIIGATPAFDGKRIYALAYSGSLLCVDPKEPKILWQTPTPDSGDITVSPAVWKDRVVFVGPDTALQCVAASTGTKVWAVDFPEEIQSSPLIIGQRVVVGCDDGILYALNLETGRKDWTFEAGAGIAASPAATQGFLVVGTQDGAVYGFVAEK